MFFSWNSGMDWYHPYLNCSAFHWPSVNIFAWWIIFSCVSSSKQRQIQWSPKSGVLYIGEKCSFFKERIISFYGWTRRNLKVTMFTALKFLTFCFFLGHAHIYFSKMYQGAKNCKNLSKLWWLFEYKVKLKRVIWYRGRLTIPFRWYPKRLYKPTEKRILRG